ncbi:MAG TPA: response regulator [Rhodobacteraceae bacterium]|nr:response regulator [Paracoccaceae bacterium]
MYLGSERPTQLRAIFWLLLYSCALASLGIAFALGFKALAIIFALILVFAAIYGLKKSKPEKPGIVEECRPENDPVNAESLQIILDDLPVALIRLSTDGVIVGVNGAARTLLGNANLVGKNFSEEIEGLGRSMRVRVAEALKGSGIRTTEMGRFLKNGKEIFLQVSLMAMRFANRDCLVVVLSDKTELKILEAQFVQSQKMQAVGQLAGGVAHDFNNLLTAINGHCDLLLLRHEAGDQDYGDLIQIRQNANRAAALVRQLLAFSRKQTLRPKVLKLARTLAQLSQLLNRLLGEKVNLKIDIAEDLNLVRVDERQLEQVIMNLVVNARDAMLDGGDVMISADNVELKKPLERDRATVPIGTYVCISIKDTGTGIAPDNIAKIFEPFFTTKRVGEGTGLGLSTVYGIIKQTGGFVFVDSILEQGTNFIVYLPCYVGEISSEPDEIETQPAMPIEADLSGRILLVEDEDPVRSFAARALRLRGYKVDEAESAEKALELLALNGAQYDLYISDIIMPGKDGPTWVREALQKHPKTKVIFMSGYAEDAFEDGKPDIRDAGFLQKPFSLAELSASVGQRLQM